MTRVLVTGASGFIGSALTSALEARGLEVRGAHRNHGAIRPCDVAIGAMSGDTDWRAALEGVTHVVHLAGPAHARFSERTLRTAIVDASGALAAQAEAAGVRRLVFVSSIKAGAARSAGAPLRECDGDAPADAYGRAKRDAEAIVLAHQALKPVALRPPLVFGPEAKANFARLLRLAASPLPLPLARFDNRRSLISRGSLLEAIIAVIESEAGPSGAFYVADRPALSTAAMVSALREGLGRAPALFAAPGASALAPRALRENLECDDSAFRAGYAFHGQDARTALVACAAAWKARA